MRRDKEIFHLVVYGFGVVEVVLDVRCLQKHESSLFFEYCFFVLLILIVLSCYYSLKD